MISIKHIIQFSKQKKKKKNQRQFEIQCSMYLRTKTSSLRFKSLTLFFNISRSNCACRKIWILAESYKKSLFQYKPFDLPTREYFRHVINFRSGSDKWKHSSAHNFSIIPEHFFFSFQFPISDKRSFFAFNFFDFFASFNSANSFTARFASKNDKFILSSLR